MEQHPGSAPQPRSPGTLYCDESGNTGSNLNDLDQPFYVLAGLVIPDGEAPSVEALVQRLRVEGAVQSWEMKAGALMKTSRGRPALGRFLMGIRKMHVGVFVGVYEKRFGICARMVDDCLDASYNDRVEIGRMDNPLVKQRHANTLYDALGDDTLRPWADAWRKGDQSLLVAATRDVCAALRKAGKKRLAHQIEGALVHADSWVQPASALESVNLPVWIDFYMRVEYFCEAAGLGPVQIVHDEIPQFAAAYQEALRHDQQGRHHILIGPHGTPWVHGIRRLTEYKSKSSLSCISLQAADAVASSVGGFLKGSSESGRIDPVLAPVAEFIAYLETVSTLLVGVKHVNMMVARSKYNLLANLPILQMNTGRRLR